jgi:hypothetical protein
MYQRIIRSYIRFEQLRGLPFSVAKARGITTFTSFAVLNLVAITYLVQVLGGPPIVYWMANHGWALVPVIGVLFGVHFALARALPKPRALYAASEEPGTSGSIEKYLWACYFGFTILLWVGTGVVVLVYLTHPHL